mmetsp:Transcript_90752/g.252431  ORF Transcript_90752/g.252431 Transcript_90752/m.252431 type:complete len:344 (-) Transcript_90752:169-1200(-)
MGQAAGSLGAQLEDRYFRQKVKLGEGSFGTVWRAVDRLSGNTVAVKQLDKASMPHRGVTPQNVEKEISLMRQCRHENIIQLFDTFEDNKSIYLALEYCDGGDFGDKLREQGLSISEREAASWMRQICNAVCVLHTQKICHRDIKPENFMVHGKTVLKLADFGLATTIPTGRSLQVVCGTPAFNAPEQRGAGRRGVGYGLPVDMWAVGVSMYMVMFGGKHPFIDDHRRLDDSLLVAGKLDFRDRSSATGFLGLEGPGGSGLRFSEEARQLCRRMVDPDPDRRILAAEAVYEPWLQLGEPPRGTTTSAPAGGRPGSKPRPKGGAGSCPPGMPARVAAVPTPARHL